MPTGEFHVDILAIAAHRDDVELICGGTLIKAVKLGRSVGIIDLTAGEMGTRGSAELRAEEAKRAGRVLGATVRENLGLPDAGIVNTPDTRALIARTIRKFSPAIVVAPSQLGRHPDHRVASELVRDACFVAGLAKVASDVPPHRPRKILHAIGFRQDFQKPTFVVDISEEMEQKLEAVRCYGSQFDGAKQGGEVYPTGDSLYDRVRQEGSHYGSHIRTRYGEPFYTTETMRVDDIAALEVATF
jgi:bacillithiol biosynthesis deacetylase BshB1